MPRYRHPRAGDDTPGHPPARVHVSRAAKAAVDGDGCFDAPRAVAESIADRHGTTPEAMLSAAESGPSGGATAETTSGSEDDDADDTATESGTCETVKADGEVCGRDLPCPYHSED